ncbi:MAG: branched-chain amino acid ABC transporter permease [Gammaproteobacteria bacterium]|nr:branched-chain amino acid ABC transporter permease [Gammaproteobacteria bacterium]
MVIGIGVAVTLLVPLVPLFQPYMIQFAMLWVLILMALTWDILGGQMGYNSFGNVIFVGVGMYTTAVVQREMFFGAEYASVAGQSSLSLVDYLTGLGIGMGSGAILSVALAAFLGSGILALRGHYFAICTLGLGVAAGELASGWDYIGAGSGLVTPLPPDGVGESSTFFYYVFFVLVVITFMLLRWLYSCRFGLAINAIRDDEDKAEAMGLHTTRYKVVAWCVAAFFLALTGGAFGNLMVFIDPTETAFAGATFGVWMVLMAVLGGKGRLWGPVIGATVFHVLQETFWTYLFGWQRVALGLLIVAVVVFFPLGIVGWVRERFAHRFGEAVDPAARTEQVTLGDGT